MKRIKIGYNNTAEEQYQKDITAKIEAFKNLVQYLEQFNDNIDRKALYNAPFEYGIELTTANHKPAFKSVILNKVFELIGFSVSHYEQLCRPFDKVKYHFDPITLEYTAPEFTIYAETLEQIERYEAIQNVCKSIEVLRKHTPLHNGSLLQSLRGTLLPDYANNSIQPNIHFVLNGTHQR